MIFVDLRGPGAARVRAAAALSCVLTLVACGSGGRPLAEETVGAHPRLPAPAAPLIPTTRFSTATPWAPGASPRAPAGFTVTRLAQGLSHPRWLHVLPNGDVLAAESMTLPAEPDGLTERIGFYLARVDGSRGQSADTIVLLRDADGDGVVETRSEFLRGAVKQPFGMALIGDRLYVAGTGGVWQYAYRDGDTELTGQGRKILDLPVGGYNHHWTRNILARQDGQKLYVTVGSVSDFGEGNADIRRLANVLEINPDGSGERIFTSGIRNPTGLAIEPESRVLWTVVPERDMLGDDLVPDYLTRVRDGDFYGWPWSYWGTHIDERVTPPNPAMAARAITPDYSLGAHTTPLGLVFYTARAFPSSWKGGAFISQHGSWNRSHFSGYKVVWVRFENGLPVGQPVDFLTQFMPDVASGIAFGRPAGLAVDNGGSLLVADDTGGIIWRVTPVQAGGVLR